MICRLVLKPLLVGMFFTLGAFVCGCTTNYDLNTTPISKWKPHETLPLKVNLVLTDRLRAYVFDKPAMGSHLKFPIGEVLSIDARAMCRAAFAQVVVTDGKSPTPAGVDAVIEPEIGLVDRSLSAWAFDPVDMTADLKWSVSDLRGKVIWLKTVRGTAKYNQGNGFNHRSHAREHVDLVMIDLFNKSLEALTNAPEIRTLAAKSPTR